MSFIIRILGNSLGLYAANILVAGFVIKGGFKEYIISGVLLGLLNLLVKPILKVVSLPLIIITLGFFTLVINAILLWIVDYIFDFIYIETLMALFWGTIIISTINIFVTKTAKIVT